MVLRATFQKVKKLVVGNQTPPARGGKEFSSELEQFAQLIEQRQPFAFARFNDGEMKILFGDIFDVAKNRIGNTYIPEDEAAEQQRVLLKDALQFKTDGYYVGIVCPCCEKEADFYKLKEMSGQSEKSLTWANVFVNSNFPVFQSRVVPLFADRTIVFVGNTLADSSALPFRVVENFDVGDNAWVKDYERLLTEINSYIETEQLSDAIFIFCAGVLSNLLIYKLYDRYPDNTYLDLGSVFDVELGLGKTRRYLRKGKTLYKTCVWA